MSPMDFLTKSIKFGGVKRNYIEHRSMNPKDIGWLIETTEKLFDSHAKQVHQEMRLLKEIAELKSELGKENDF